MLLAFINLHALVSSPGKGVKSQNEYKSTIICKHCWTKALRTPLEPVWRSGTSPR